MTKQLFRLSLVAALLTTLVATVPAAPGETGPSPASAPAADLADGAWSLLPQVPARIQHTAVWDAARGRMLVFGGADTSGSHNDLWSYSAASNGWGQLTPSGSLPSTRNSHTAVWDKADSRMLVFGGSDGSTHLNDLWSYQAATNSWVRLAPGGTPPSARIGHTAVWDEARSRMLVFGGADSSGPRNDLWSYEAASDGWVQLAPTGAVPSARSRHAAVWDTAQNRLLIFGGYLGSTNSLGENVEEFFNDLWSYEAISNSWVQLTPTGTPPSVRTGHTAIWDEGGSRMLVFGGYHSYTFFGDYYEDFFNDLWGYQALSNSWLPLAPSGTLPSARAYHTAVWDASLNRMLVFGGSGGSGYLNDLWSYEATGNSWVLLAPTGAVPSARSGHTAVWDATQKRLLVFGGWNASSLSLLNDLWSYWATNNSWLQLIPSGNPPSTRDGHTAAWDEGGSHMLNFGGWSGGGYRNDLWSYQATNNSWVSIAPSGTLPSARIAHTAVWDAAGSRMIVFGGSDSISFLNDLPSYQAGSNSWLQLVPNGTPPSARTGHTAVWDEARRRMFVFGGWNNSSVLNDLWSYQAGAPPISIPTPTATGTPTLGSVAPTLTVTPLSTLTPTHTPMPNLSSTWTPTGTLPSTATLTATACTQPRGSSGRCR
jgi:N-acetylneuraminic acid mutarotase